MVNLAELLSRAVALHQAGDLASAEALYRQVLAAEPRQADAWHLLGLLMHQQGKHADAVEHVRRAITLDAGQALYHHHLGGVYRATGDRLQSIAAFQEAIRLRADNPETHNNLAVVLLDVGRDLEAEDHCRRALELQPNYADACNNWGVALQRQKKLAAAVDAFVRAIALRPDYLQAHRNLATLLMELKRPAEAVVHFDCMTQLAPGEGEYRYQLGVAQHAAGNYAGAKAAYATALAIQPDMAAAHYALAAVWEDEGNMIEARASYQRALELRPHHASTHNNLGNVHKHLNRLDLAVESYQQAIAIDSRHFNALVNLSSALHEQGRQAESLSMYQRARRERDTPALAVRSQLLSPLIVSSFAEAAQERERLDRNLDELISAGIKLENPATEVGMTPFYWAYLGCDVRPLLEKLAGFYRRAAPSLEFVAPHCQRGRHASRRRLRIGFLSRYLYDHPVGMNYSRLLEGLPADRFEIVLIRQPGRSDAITKEFERCAQQMIPLGYSLPDAQRSVAQAELDVLIYSEIGMDPLTYYLAYSRLAPVQCVVPGHPITSGIDTVDYYISSEGFEPANGQDHYTERLFKIESVPTTFTPPAPGQSRSREFFGLPQSAPIYMCAQTLTKIHPDFDALAARILAADPEGRLVLFAGNQHHWTVALRERLAHTLGSAIDRVIFLPRQNLPDFRAALTLADVLLDTPHFNGFTTSLEALALGSPIVTLPGPFMRGRQTLACYLKLGASEGIAASEEDYVQLAVRTAQDRQFRERFRKQITRGRDRLFAGNRPMDELAGFLEYAIERAAT